MEEIAITTASKSIREITSTRERIHNASSTLWRKQVKSPKRMPSKCGLRKAQAFQIGEIIHAKQPIFGNRTRQELVSRHS
jgi:hypothetical protein